MERRSGVILINPAEASEPGAQVEQHLRQAMPDLVRREDVQQAVADLRNGGARPAIAVAVIGPDVPQPTLAARWLHEANPSVHIVFAAHAEREADLQRELLYALPSGSQWSLARAEPGISAVVREAVRTVNQRNQFRTTLDRINLQLSSRTAPDAADLRRLVASDHYLANILTHAHDAILSLDLRGTIVSWNVGAQKLFGTAAADAVGRTLVEIARWPDGFTRAVARAAAGELLRQEFSVELADGPAELDVTLSPVLDQSRRIIAISAIVRDVTEQKRAEAERAALLEAERAARAEAERAGRLKDEFLATLSHELRTPLNAILGWAYFLEHGGTDPATMREAITAIAKNAKAQAKLVEDLLDMSRIISGKLRLEVQELSPAEVVEAAIESVMPTIQSKSLRLERVLDTEAGPVLGDRGRLLQVFWNLLTNAAKFTPKGGKIQVVVCKADSRVEVRVSDTGEGIQADFLPHIFDRFRQADGTTTRKHGGLGLGLALVKQLVEAHGGTVAAHSPGTGRGSTFTVTFPLPIARRHAAPAGSSAVASWAAIDDLDLSDLKVLIVDDEPDAQVLARRILEERGVRIFTAGSAIEGLELLKSERPDVLISDIGMPGHDGYELVRWVRSLPPEAGGRTPAAALTAFARPEDRTQALRAGYQSHLAKPASPVELMTVVASLAGRTGGV